VGSIDAKLSELRGMCESEGESAYISSSNFDKHLHFTKVLSSNNFMRRCLGRCGLKVVFCPILLDQHSNKLLHGQSLPLLQLKFTLQMPNNTVFPVEPPKRSVSDKRKEERKRGRTKLFPHQAQLTDSLASIYHTSVF